MRRLLPVLFCAACVAQPPAPGTTAAISFGGATYPIERLESFPEQWRVVTPDGRVPCRAPTEQDCYWSLRAHLQALAELDDLG